MACVVTEWPPPTFRQRFASQGQSYMASTLHPIDFPGKVQPWLRQKVQCPASYPIAEVIFIPRRSMMTTDVDQIS